jgi:hypothetical protein
MAACHVLFRRRAFLSTFVTSHKACTDRTMVLLDVALPVGGGVNDVVLCGGFA